MDIKRWVGDLILAALQIDWSRAAWIAGGCFVFWKYDKIVFARHETQLEEIRKLHRRIDYLVGITEAQSRTRP